LLRGVGDNLFGHYLEYAIIKNKMYVTGLFILLFGLAFFLRNLGVLYFPGSFWSLFYPLVIVSFGVALICVTHKGRQLLKRIKEIFSAK